MKIKRRVMNNFGCNVIVPLVALSFVLCTFVPAVCSVERGDFDKTNENEQIDIGDEEILKAKKLKSDEFHSDTSSWRSFINWFNHFLGCLVDNPVINRICYLFNSNYVGSDSSLDENDVVEDTSKTLYMQTKDSNSVIWTTDEFGTIKTDKCPPVLNIMKTANMTYSKEGDYIEFNVTVENTGDVDLNLVNFTDSLMGDISNYFSHVLAPGVQEWYVYDYLVPIGAPDPLINTAEANYNASDTLYLYDSSTVEVDLVYPGLVVTKTANLSYSKVGDWVEFTVTVENTGDVALNLASFDDSLMGDISGHFSMVLAPGVVESYVYDYQIPVGAPDPVVNYVEAHYFITDLPNDIWDSDLVEVDLVYPGLVVTKTANLSYSKVGDWVEFTVTVENTGDVALNLASFDDSLMGGISGHFSMVLAPGVVESYVYDYLVPIGAPDPLINTAEANYNASDTLYLYDSSTVEVDLVYPGLVVTKAADPTTVSPGCNVTFAITVENTGDVALNLDSFDDSLMGDISGHFSMVLAPGVVESYVYDYQIPVGAPDPVVNYVEAHYFITDLPNDIWDSDLVEVDLVYPGLVVTKAADPNQGSPGTIVNFTILVKNTGETILDPVSVVDTIPGNMSFVDAFPSPDDINGNDITWYNVGPISSGDSTTIYLLAQIDDTTTNSEVWVDDSWTSQSDVNLFDSSLIWRFNAFRTIQDGVDAVFNCGTVHVRGGVYLEQILINKSLYLLAEPGVTINAPMDLEYYTLNGPSSGSWAPVIFAYGGTLMGNDVTGNETIGVVVDGFTMIDNFIPNSTGILYHNVECGFLSSGFVNYVMAVGFPPCGDSVTDSTYAEVEVEKYIESIISNNTIINFDIGIKFDGCSNCATIIHNHIMWPYHTIGKIGIVITGSSGCEPENIEIHYNFIGVECGDNIGIWNQVSEMANATLNWWSAPDGPSSLPNGDNYDPITGRIADGVGEKVVGFVHFDPWAGIDAIMTISQTSAMVGEPIFFNSADSYACHMDGTYYDFYEVKWKFDDGYYSFDDSTTHIYNNPGVYHASLRVRAIDMDLWPNFMLDWDKVTITISQPGTPLEANADAEDLGGYEGTPNQITRFYSYAIGGMPTYNYTWDFGDGTSTAYGQNPTHIYDEDDIYTVILTVTDSNGETDTDTVQATVSSGTLTAFTNGPYSNMANIEIYFSGYAIGGTEPYSYEWDFGDGTPSQNGQTVIHAYENPGVYNITFTVSDNNGDIDITTNAMIGTNRPEEYIEITSLKSGWNFISLPYDQNIEKTTLFIEYSNLYFNWTQATTIIDWLGSSLVNPLTFWWDENVQSYSISDMFEPGYGYWIYAEKDCQILVQEGVVPDDGLISDLGTGWNLVGIPYDQDVDRTNILVDDVPWNTAVSTGWISDFVFGWSRTGQSYTFADTFMPGYAYWIFAYQPCTLERVET